MVTSLIVARPGVDPRTNFSGVAPDATILALRALQQGPQVGSGTGSGTSQQESLTPTIEAVNYAVDQHVDIINLSQQGSDTPAFRAAIERAVSAGILVVAAAGNHGRHAGIPYPAAYPGVLAVGMSTTGDAAQSDSQSNAHLQVSVAAPGDSVLGLLPSGNAGQAYQTDTGTSFAAPLVSGTAALVMQQFPSLNAAQVRARLEQTADQPNAAVPDPQLGYGIVNPYRALTDPSAAPSASPAPSRTPAPLPNPSDQPKPDHSVRDRALTGAGAALGASVVALLVARSLPAGRRRRWRPAGPGE